MKVPVPEVMAKFWLAAIVAPPLRFEAPVTVSAPPMLVAPPMPAPPVTTKAPLVVALEAVELVIEVIPA